MRLIIVGFGPAGFAASLYARKQNPEAEITVVDGKDYLAHNCYIPFALAGIVRLSDMKHDPMLGKMRINHITYSKVVSVDKENKKIEIEKKDGSREKLEYDKLIISTGSRSFVPKIEGIDGDNVYTLYSYERVEALEKKIKESSSALVIGAGAIGVETAFALKKAGLQVSIAEAKETIMQNSFDSELAGYLQDEIKNSGINLQLNSKVEKINSKTAILNGSEIQADLIVLATGVVPNAQLLDGIANSSRLGIAVNEHMQTSANDIYAAGDCCEATNLITKKPCFSKLATTAYLQGMVAGVNAVGGQKKYAGTLTTFVSKFMSYEIASTGLTENDARANGFDVVSSRINATAKPEVFPDNNKIILKLIAEKGSGRILGCQGFGFGAAERINLVAQAIYSNAKLGDLIDYENAYCPSVSKTYDMLKVATELCIRRL
ncbi:Coenzyme A disulfide reductase [Candidatus Bilamarchaeum dharawalense]|uniref:Coenzyme A disulfide reductase n=1 Tax=Candidatus Bilamarchaeum dharawalense TaxID=2885759 RepID=A0A5E4LQT2_9ARCH|nr:Coenzyme A disulfide reductase [Candidatus Bilamarchaeum dharawalense]